MNIKYSLILLSLVTLGITVIDAADEPRTSGLAARQSAVRTNAGTSVRDTDRKKQFLAEVGKTVRARRKDPQYHITHRRKRLAASFDARRLRFDENLGKRQQQRRRIGHTGATAQE